MSLVKEFKRRKLGGKEKLHWPVDDFVAKNNISLAADWGESDPWTQFLCKSRPHMALILQMRKDQFKIEYINNVCKISSQNNYKKNAQDHKIKEETINLWGWVIFAKVASVGPIKVRQSAIAFTFSKIMITTGPLINQNYIF